MNTYMQTLSLTHTHRRNKEGGAGDGRAVMELSAFPRPEDGFVWELGSEPLPGHGAGETVQQVKVL